VDRPHVCVVDDDPVFLRITSRVLQKAGYRVSTAADLSSARSLLGADGQDPFSCVLIDYQLPDGDGTDLLRWLHHRESAVAPVMVTASEEHALVKQTMVEGATNFLQKPVDANELRQAVAAATIATRDRRRSKEMRRQVKTAAQAQDRWLGAALDGDAFVEYKFCPKYECGGDFLMHHRFPDASEVFVVSDVAGHDLVASAQSSFFHGWMTGVLKYGGDIQSALEDHNRLLLDLSSTVAGSIAVTALEVHPSSKCMTCWNCGGPPPVFDDWGGWVVTMGARASSPLGWFDDVRPTRVGTGIPPGPVWIWTDGLEALADSFEASPLSLAYALLASSHRDHDKYLEQTKDDVLVVRLWPGASRGFHPPACWHPLLADEYGAREIAAIDSLQQLWKNSLRMALPALPSDTVHDVLLAGREAVLNALNHGCRGSETAGFQMLYHPGDRLLRLRVRDPGPGYAFDWRSAIEQEPSGVRCGLVMIHSISSRVTVERNGAELTMDYVLSGDLHIVRQEQNG